MAYRLRRARGPGAGPKRNSAPRAAVIGLGVLLGACTAATQDNPTPASGDSGTPTIVVASFDFSESHILGELYAQALQRQGGYRVERQLGLGSREIVAPALEQDHVDLVPEYMGSSLHFLSFGRGYVGSNPAAMHQSLYGAFADRGVRVLDFAPAQNQNGVVVARETAARFGLRRISDLEPVAPRLILGGPPECPQRDFCLRGLEETYGLRFEKFEPLDTGGPATIAALEIGAADVAVLFTTDPHLADKRFVLLKDDRNLQPAENVVPVVRDEIVDTYGSRLVGLIDKVSRQLTTADLRLLNHRVELEGAQPARAAAEWLGKHGFGRVAMTG